ncbi:MAG: hypothetical protein ACOX25_02530 [Caldicoprobacterales bacterium]
MSIRGMGRSIKTRTSSNLQIWPLRETGMGNIGDKITKHRNKILGVINDVMKAKSVGFLE